MQYLSRYETKQGPNWNSPPMGNSARIGIDDMKRYGSVLLIACLLFVACDTLHNPSGGAQSGYGTVRIALLGGDERTAFPSIEYDRIEYTFTKIGGAPVTLKPNSQGLFALEVGEWQVAVMAYTTVGTNSYLAAIGASEAFTVKGGAALSIAIPLVAASASGNGSFSYHISYPAGTAVESYSLTNLIDSRAVALNPAAEGNAISQSLDIPAGYYLFNIRLRIGSRLAGIHEVIHIYPLSSTKFERSFVDADFSHYTIFPEDFDISGTGTYVYDGSPKAVTITAKAGKTPAAITVYYIDMGNGASTQSAAAPTNTGIYLVTFDVAAAPGWNAATGLAAGAVTIRGPGATVSAPTVNFYTYNSITINAVSPPVNGQSVEYAISTSSSTEPAGSWQDSLTFSNLAPVTIYYVWARSKANFPYDAGAASCSPLVTTDKSPGAGIQTLAKAASRTDDSITIAAATLEGSTGQSIEYAISTVLSPEPTGTWQSGFTFNGLNQDTTYYVWARSVEDSFYYTGSGTPSAGITTYTVPSTKGITMAWIPAGTFTMGSPDGTGGSYDEPGRWSDEDPHEVELTSGFYMGVYQVTQDEWYAVMSTNPSDFDGSAGTGPALGETQGERPVEQVSWYDALVFCNMLSTAEGLTPAYKILGTDNPASWGLISTTLLDSDWDAVEIVDGADGYRLPTETQWEYACRAGTITAFNDGVTEDYNDVNSDSLTPLGWFAHNSGNMTHQVGRKPPNDWGLYDMHGNVFEWCWDWYDDYPLSFSQDPLGPPGPFNDCRVFRGGGGADPADNARSAYRGSDEPFKSFNTVGIRLVRP